jgi:transcriptional regulator with XRE-family HTH domain
MIGMMSAASSQTVGDLLRDWRHRTRRSQLDLALEADISARHLSFVESGRSNPSRELLLHLAEHLEVPLRERNTLLLAAGYAPIYPETPLDAAFMAPVRAAFDQLLAGHAPFPALIVDRSWNIVAANEPLAVLLSEGVSPDLLTPPINALRVCLSPDGLAPRIRNFDEYSAHLMARLRRHAVLTGHEALTTLYEELERYPGVRTAEAPVASSPLPFVPLRLRSSNGAELSFFSTIATFGTALDITLAELAIESFFPADTETAAALKTIEAVRHTAEAAGQPDASV